MRISNENKQAVYESVMNALSKTVKGVLDKKVNESSENAESVFSGNGLWMHKAPAYYANTADGKYVMSFRQRYDNEHGDVWIVMCGCVLENYIYKFYKHKKLFDITPEGYCKIPSGKLEGKYAVDLIAAAHRYKVYASERPIVLKKYRFLQDKLNKMFDEYIKKYNIKTYDEFMTNLDKVGSPLLEVFDEVKIGQKQNKSLSTRYDIPTDGFTDKINGFDSAVYKIDKEEVVELYNNVIENLDHRLPESNAKEYAIMYMKHINNEFNLLIKNIDSKDGLLYFVKSLKEISKHIAHYVNGGDFRFE